MIFPEYFEKSGEFDKNRENGRLHEFSGELECLLRFFQPAVFGFFYV